MASSFDPRTAPMHSSEALRSGELQNRFWARFLLRLYSPIAIVTILCLVCHLVVVFQFHFLYSGTEIYQSWANPFHAILGISLGITLLMPLVVGKNITLLFIGIRMLMYILIGIPLGDNIDIEFTLITILILEINLHLLFPANLLVSFFLIAIFIVFQQPLIVWGSVNPSVSAINLLSFTFFSFLLSVLSCFQVLSVQRLKLREREAGELDSVIDKLTTANAQFQDYSYRIMEESTLNERNRISRELHDTIGYCLTNVNMMMEAAQSLSPEKDTKLINLLKKVQQEAKDGLQETRRALYLLRAKTTSMPQGLKSILRLCETFQSATGVEVRVKPGNAPWNFGEAVDLVIFRVVQEGLTNALSHGKADEIDVILRHEDNWLNVFVRDDGQGVEDIEHLKKGIGLSGMQERLNEIGGHMEMMSDSAGFAVSAWIPFHPSKKESESD